MRRLKKVWSHLVDASKRIRWFCGGDDIPADVGATFRMAFNHARITDEKPPAAYARFDGTQPDLIDTATVLESDRPRRLRMTFGSGGDGQPPSEVTFDFTPQGDSTLLVITHEKAPNRKELIGYAGGWNAHLDILADEIASRPHSPFWTNWARYKAEMETKAPQ